MICPKNGNCMMNTKIHTDVDFCISPKCISPRKERMAIASRICELLKKEKLTQFDLKEIDKLKALYAQSLKGGDDSER